MGIGPIADAIVDFVGQYYIQGSITFGRNYSIQVIIRRIIYRCAVLSPFLELSWLQCRANVVNLGIITNISK